MDEELKEIVRNGSSGASSLDSKSVTFKSPAVSMDSGWSWVVLLSSFMIHVIIFGQMVSMALFYTEFVRDFAAYGSVAVSWVIATQVALSAATAPIGSILANKYGYRLVVIIGALISSAGFMISSVVEGFWMLFISFGVLTGLGSGVVYAPSFGVLALYFEKRKSFATAAVTVGTGLGIVILPPLLRNLIDEFSWRGAALITAGTSLNIIPCAALFSRHQKPIPMTFHQSADVSLFRKVSFHMLIVHYFLMAGFNVFAIKSIQFATRWRFVPEEEAPLILSVQGVMNIVGRMSSVAINSSPRTSGKSFRFTLLHLTTLTGGLAVIAYPLWENLTGLCVSSGLIGLLLGCRWSLLPGIQLELLSSKRFSTSWSYGMFFLGIGTLALPPLGEIMAEVSRDPRSSFFLGGTCILMASICTAVVHLCQPSRKAKASVFLCTEKLVT